MKVGMLIKVVNVAIVVAVIAFFIALGSLLLSVAQLRLGMGEVSVETVGTVVKVRIPAIVVNGGQYAISGLSVETAVKDQAEVVVAKGVTGPITIPAYTSMEVAHVLSFDLAALSSEALKRLMFNDQTLRVDVKAFLTIPPFIALTVKAAAPFEWGAPVKDFKVEGAAFKPYNQTHVLISLPVSFRNNSPYVPVEADVRAELVDAKERLKGAGALTIRAGPKTTFKGTVNLPVKFSEEEFKELLFKDIELNYKLLLRVIRGGVEVFTLTEPVSYPWRAPLANLQVGGIQLSPYNVTHLRFKVPVSFENRSPIVDVAMDLEAEVYNATSGALQGVGLLPVKAPRQAQFQGVLEGYVLLPREAVVSLLLQDGELSYRVDLKGDYQGVPVRLSRTVKQSWGAPVKDLKLGKPEAKPYNATHFKLTVPMNFTNNSDFYDLKANLTVDFYDATGSRVGVGIPQTLNVPVKTTYQGVLQGLLSLTALGQQYTAKLTFETPYGKAVKEVVLTA